MTDWSGNGTTTPKKREETESSTESGGQNEPNPSENGAEKQKIEIMKTIKKCEKMGGEEFEAEQERILQELSKQKATIKALLDEMQAAKKERETYNIQKIFKKSK